MEVFEEVGWVYGFFEFDEIREYLDFYVEMFEYDCSEMDLNKFCEKFD